MTETATSHDVGILFVHGVGQPAWRDTLRRFGGPLCDWITRRLASAAPWSALGDFEPTLREMPTLRDDAAPAHAEFFVPLPTLWDSRRVGSTSRWLLAESWWARDVDTPTFRALVRWGFQTIPLTVGSHFARRLGIAWIALRLSSDRLTRLRLGLRLMLEGALFTTAVGLSSALVAASLLLALLALIPLPWVGRALRRIQSLLAATIGDSFALVERRMGGESAIVGRLQHDIDWLRQRCAYVAVVAHSQGAAAAHLALRRASTRAQVDALLTFGSGVRKLEELRQARESQTSAVLLLLASLLLVAVPFLAWYAGWAAPGACLLLALLLVLVAWNSFELLQDDNLKAQLLRARPRWKDFYARADPVPNGPVFLEDRYSDKGRSVLVSNRGSWWRDHTSYWDNRDELVSRMASVLVQDLHAGGHIPEPLRDALEVHGDRLARVAAQRARRVSWLRRSKWLAAAVAIGVAWRSPSAAAVATAWLLSALPTSWSARLPALADWQHGPLTLLARCGTAGVLLLASGLLLDLFWRAWDASDADAFFGSSSAPGWPYNPRSAARLTFAAGASFILAAQVARSWVGRSRWRPRSGQRCLERSRRRACMFTGAAGARPSTSATRSPSARSTSCRIGGACHSTT